MVEAGTSSGTFTQDVQTDMSNISTATDQLATNIDQKTNDMITYIGNLMTQVDNWRREYLEAIRQMIKANEELAASEYKAPPTPPKDTSGGDDEVGGFKDTGGNPGGNPGDKPKSPADDKSDLSSYSHYGF
jgi:hypothetical protein